MAAEVALKAVPDERMNLLRRWGEMDTEFSSWMSQGMEISRYLLPRSGRFFTSDRNNGTRRYNSILDNTATRALRILGAGLMGAGVIVWLAGQKAAFLGSSRAVAEAHARLGERVEAFKARQKARQKTRRFFGKKRRSA